METYRRRVDYGSGGVERESEALIGQTRESLAAVRRFIEDESSPA